MPPTAEILVDRLAAIVRQRLPPGVTPAYFDGFLRRNRPALVSILDRQLVARRERNRSGAPSATGYLAGTRSTVGAVADAPDLWSASQRTAANLPAMRIAASKRPDEMTDADRAALTAYSGWGGLSLQSAAAQFPTGFPVPEERGLIHEFYTPTKVAREVARVIRPLVPLSRRRTVWSSRSSRPPGSVAS